MGNISVSWLLLVTLTLLFCCNLSEANKHGNKLPSAVVVGTVYCDTCFQQDFTKTSHFISGASVAVKCSTSFYKEVETNEHGVFQLHLPTAVTKHVKSIKGCQVKLLHSSEPSCAVASTATSSSLYLKGRKEGTHIFSAGFFTFKPLKQPEFCNQKPISLSLGLATVPPTIPNPTVPAIPTLPTPTLPTPTIPTLPTPTPTLPTPTLPTPTLPTPTLPTPTPTLPTPTIPTPTLPTPTIPTPTLPTPIPTVPAVPSVPTTPTLPTPIPTVPAVPTVPTTPTLPPAPGLPGIPGIPPAITTEKTPP